MFVQPYTQVCMSCVPALYRVVPLPDEKGSGSDIQEYLLEEVSTSGHGAPGRITAYW